MQAVLIFQKGHLASGAGTDFTGQRGFSPICIRVKNNHLSEGRHNLSVAQWDHMSGEERHLINNTNNKYFILLDVKNKTKKNINLPSLHI